MSINFKRIIAAIIDHCIAVIIMSFFIELIKNFTNNFFIIGIICLPIYFFIILFKDSLFKNASVGKKILKIKVVEKDQKSLKLRNIIIRNITIILLPIEVLLVIINNKRIGDIWANTTVVEN